MSTTLVRQLYEQRLIAWADLQDLPVEAENVEIVPPAKGAYLSIFVLPAATDGGFLEGGHRALVGVVQISIRDRLGGGVAECNRIADLLAALFPQNLLLTSGGFTVQQITPLSVAPGFASDGRYVVPASFRYRGDTTD